MMVSLLDISESEKSMSEANLPSDVYDKDLNFLFGSGASFGLFPTLALGIRNNFGNPWTLEGLATYLKTDNDSRFDPLFMHYYNTCIYPAQTFKLQSVVGDKKRENVVHNYRIFLETVLRILQRRKSMDKRCLGSPLNRS